MTRRAERVSNLIRQEICELLLEHVNDPRLNGLISVTEVSTSADLKNSRIYVSIMGDDDMVKEAMKGFRSATGYFRKELSHRLVLRHVPELSFEIDNSLERGARILGIIDRVSQEDSEYEHKRDSKRKQT
jgi:ribosome-binding factor A